MKSHSWLSSKELSVLAGVSLRRATRALTRCSRGEMWRSHHLIVRRVRGRGGNNGWCYEVRLDSLPAEYQLNYVPLTPIERSIKDTSKSSSNWRYQIISPALAYPSGSRLRAESIKLIASQKHFKSDGSRRQVTDRTIRNWIKLYETKGISGLNNTIRSDKNLKKVMLSRRWDKGVKLPIEIKQEITQKIEKYIRSLWAGLQPGSGWREVQRAASIKLLRITIDACPEMPLTSVRNYCKVPRNTVEKWRSYEAVAVHDKDAKRYFDGEPRITRGISTLLPMQIVMGDVHPIDILYQRDDGSTATARGIFWMDVATGRLLGTIRYFEKGKGVRQEDVIQSFEEMANNQRWGVPGNLYLDNGGEYNWSQIVGDALNLTAIPIWWAEDGQFTPTSKNAITKAQPYNSSAKGLLEGAFAILEKKHFSKINGWIGGDRMRKKTTNVGKAPVPFVGSKEELSQLIQNAVEIYNNTPQSGRLKGLSPNQKFDEMVRAGWKVTKFAEGVLESIFCKSEQRTLRQGRVQYKGSWYYHDALTNPALGNTVEIRIPLFGETKRLAIFSQTNEFLCVASPDHIFAHDDINGAVESNRRKKKMREHVNSMKNNVQAIDIQELLKEEARFIVTPPKPDQGAVIRLSDHDENAGKELAKPSNILDQEKRDKQEERYRIFDKLMASNRPSGVTDDPYEQEVHSTLPSSIKQQTSK